MDVTFTMVPLLALRMVGNTLAAKAIGDQDSEAFFEELILDHLARR